MAACLFHQKEKRLCVPESLGFLADFYFGADDSALPLGEIQLMGRNDPDTILWLAEKKYPGKTYEELGNEHRFLAHCRRSSFARKQGNIAEDGSIKVEYTRNNYTAYEKLESETSRKFLQTWEPRRRL